MVIVPGPKKVTWYKPSREDMNPVMMDDGLHIYKGRDYDAGFESHIILNDNDLTAILVGYWFAIKRKQWGGGHYYRHYKNCVQIDWPHLSEDDKLRILDVPLPATWAKPPGKLKKDRKAPRFHRKVERDNAGNIIAYKWLLWDETMKMFVSDWFYPAYWVGNSMTADKIPTEENSNGVYCAKTPDSPILERYSKRPGVTPVRLLLSGKVLEFDHGYRAEQADIIEVMS
jgi:hypothetical protein